MSDAKRTTFVTIRANVENYLQGMELAQKSTKKLGDQAIITAQAQRDASEKTGAAFLGIGAVAAVAVAGAVYEFAKFDAKMAQLQTLSHATSAEMSQLSTAALHVGQQYGFTADDVADAQIELVKAGVSVKNILGGALTGALTLAAAGQIDVAQSTEIATIAMTQFGLKGKDIPHVADLLSAGADKALGSVADLGEALKSGGLVASQFGVSLDDTVGTLSAFANAGLIGETAGTDMRQMLLKLAKPSADAAATMNQYGISVYTASGKFVGFSGLAGELRSQLGGLTEAQRNTALATIFGSRAIAGANVLYNDGAKQIANWTAKVDDNGFAAQQAAGKLNNLEGDLTKLGAAAQTNLIETGSGANGVLRDLTQGVTSATVAVGNMPKPLLETGLGLTSVVAVTGLLGGGFLTLVPKIMATRAAMSELNITGKGLAAGLGKGAGLATVLVAISSGLENMGSSATLSASGLEKVDTVAKNLTAGSIEKLFSHASNAIFDSTTKAGKFKEALDNSFSGNLLDNESSAYKFIDGLDFGVTHLSDTYKTNEANLKELGVQLGATAGTDLPKAQQQFALLAKEAGGNANAYQELFNAMPGYKTALEQLAASQGISLTTQQLNNLAVGKGTLAMSLGAVSAGNMTVQTESLGAAATDTTGEISTLATAISNFGKADFDTEDASIAFQAAIDGATSSLKQNGKTLDITTSKGRSNMTALEQIAKASVDLSSKTLTLTGSSEKAAAKIEDGRHAFIKAAEAMGDSSTKAKELADKFGLIPGNVSTEVKTVGLPKAQSDVDVYDAHLKNIPHNITTTLTTKKTGGHADADLFGKYGSHAKGGYIGAPANSVASFAAGGYGLVQGPGTGTSDSIASMLSNGEYVIRAAAVTRLGLKAMDQINQGYLPNMAALAKAQTTPSVYVTVDAPAAAAAPTLQRPVNQQVSFVNPVVHDLYRDTAKAAQMLAATVSTQ